MEKSLLDKLTPDDLPALLPSHPDDAEVGVSGENPSESASESAPLSEPPCAN